jgi:hypothetical protein
VVSLFIYGKVKNWPETRCKARAFVYSLCAVIISISETAAIFLLGSFGENSIKACEVKDGSPGEVIYFIPIALNFPIVLLAIGLTLREKNKRRSLLPSKLVLISMMITLGASTIIKLICALSTICQTGSPYSDFLLAFSGGLFVLCYLFNPYMLQKLKIIKKSRKEQALYFHANRGLLVNKSLGIGDDDTLEISDVDMLGTFLESSNRKVSIMQRFLEILVLLNLRFSSMEDRSLRSSSFSIINHAFQKFVYSEMARDYNNTYFVRCKSHAVDFSGLTLQELHDAGFEKIRKTLGWTRNEVFTYSSNRSLINHENFIKVDNYDEGRQGLAFVTADKKLIIKMLRPAEVKYIKRSLKSYTEYICENPTSRLQKIIGLFKVNPMNCYFSLMENKLFTEGLQRYYEINPEKSTEVREFEFSYQTGEYIEVAKGENDVKPRLYDQELKYCISNDVETLGNLNAIGYYLAIAVVNDELSARNLTTDAVIMNLFEAKGRGFWKRLFCSCCGNQSQSAKNYERVVLAMVQSLFQAK